MADIEYICADCGVVEATGDVDHMNPLDKKGCSECGLPVTARIARNA